MRTCVSVDVGVFVCVWMLVRVYVYVRMLVYVFVCVRMLVCVYLYVYEDVRRVCVRDGEGTCTGCVYGRWCVCPRIYGTHNPPVNPRSSRVYPSRSTRLRVSYSPTRGLLSTPRPVRSVSLSFTCSSYPRRRTRTTHTTGLRFVGRPSHRVHSTLHPFRSRTGPLVSVLWVTSPR